MKLFHFNPHGHGVELFICALSKEDAITEAEKVLQRDGYRATLIIDMCTEKNRYTIDEHPSNKVVYVMK